jgi:hypothetical protein
MSARKARPKNSQSVPMAGKTITYTRVVQGKKNNPSNGQIQVLKTAEILS